MCTYLLVAALIAFASSTSTLNGAIPSQQPALQLATRTQSTSNPIIVLASDSDAGLLGTSGLEEYRIPYQLLTIPAGGAELPDIGKTSNSSWGGIVVVDEVSHNYDGTWRSALREDQWEDLYAYQTTSGARMVRLGAYPESQFGAATVKSETGCCSSGVEQFIRVNDSSDFINSALDTQERISSLGLWHYPAQITNSTLVQAFAVFEPSSNNVFASTTVAAVINSFPDREQMVFFTSWSLNWSSTSLEHAYVEWLVRSPVSADSTTTHTSSSTAPASSTSAIAQLSSSTNSPSVTTTRTSAANTLLLENCWWSTYALVTSVVWVFSLREFP